MNNIPDIFNLKNRNIVITGSAGVLGSQYALTLSQNGANVILLDVMNENKDLERKIHSKFGTKVKSFYVDISKENDVKNVRKEIISEYGKIDGLINNAAYTNVTAIKNVEKQQTSFENFPTEMWKKSLSVNLDGVFYCCREFGKEMSKRKKGSIVNIASIYGIAGVDQRIYGESKINSPISYTAAKGAIISMTRYLAAYWHKKNVRVNTLTLGGVEDKRYQKKLFIGNYSKKTMLGRMAQKDEYNGVTI